MFILPPRSLILAPMVGISDYPYRSLTRELGNAVSWTSFVNAKEVVYGHPHRLHDRLWFDPSERPVIFQLYGENINLMVEAAKILEMYQPDALDINLGCSVKKISQRGAGSGLLRQPDKVFEMLQSIRQAISLPLTAKIRLGWDEKSLNYMEISDWAEKAGVELLTVHGRTRSQGFNSPAIWQPIAEVKQARNIPIIGNGDVKAYSDAQKMFDSTNCDAVMIGRAAIGNPWIFSPHSEPKGDISPKFQIISEHINRMIHFYGSEKSIILFRKHLAGYCRTLNLSREVSSDLLRTTEWEVLINKLSRILKG